MASALAIAFTAVPAHTLRPPQLTVELARIAPHRQLQDAAGAPVYHPPPPSPPPPPLAASPPPPHPPPACPRTPIVDRGEVCDAERDEATMTQRVCKDGLKCVFDRCR